MGKSLFDEVLGNEELDIECPSCEKEFSVTLGQIGETVTCPHCSAEIELTDENGGISDIAQAMNELDKTIGSF